MRRESLLVGCALIGTLTLFSGCRTAQKSNEKQIPTKIESNADESASENKTSSRMCWESRLAAWLFPMPKIFQWIIMVIIPC